MGWFLNVTTATLELREPQFMQNSQSFRFWDDVYISWCQPSVFESSTSWVPLADGTLHAQYRTEHIIPPVASTIAPVKSNMKPNEFVYNDLIRLGKEGGLFHLVLPLHYLPKLSSIKPFPSYALAHNGRFVLGWIFERATRFSFEFEKALLGDFDILSRRIQEAVDSGQISAIGMERELDSIEKQLFTQRGNQLFLQEQAANYGMDIPLPLHNQLQYVASQIDILEHRKRSLWPQDW